MQSIGVPGCMLWHDITVAIARGTDPYGFAMVAYPVPTTASAIGGKVYAQSWQLNLAAPNVLVTSDDLRFVLGL